MRNISHSTITHYLKCRESYRLADLQGYSLIEKPSDPKVGLVVHAAMDPFWEHQGEIRQAMEAEAAKLRLDPYETEMAIALVSGYVATWNPKHYAPAKTEVKFRILREGYQLTGVLDAHLGGNTIVEHKTTGQDIRPGSDYWLTRRADLQMGMYWLCAPDLGIKPERIIYDVIHRPDIEPKRATPEAERKYTKATKTEPARLYWNQRETDETPAEYSKRVVDKILADPERHYQRRTLVVLQHEAERCARDLETIALDMLMVDAETPAPRTGLATGSCARCDFKAQCLEGAEWDMSRFRKRDTIR